MNAKVKKISLIAIPALFFSFAALANDTNIPLNEYESMYKYNALENKNTFIYTEGGIITVVEKIPEVTKEEKSDAEKLEDLAKKQANSIKKSEDSMKAIENTSSIKSFLIGDNLGILKFQMVQMKDQRHSLSILASETDSADIKDQINNQIETLSNEEKKVENFILKTENEFSLFGWLVASI